MWIITNCGSLGITNHLTHLLRNLYAEICKQQLEPGMEQPTGSILGKEYARLYIFTLLV